MMTDGKELDTRNPDDVTWLLRDGDGLVIDVVNGGITEQGEMTGTSANLVVVQRDGAEFVIPGELDAELALELSELLMLAAKVLDPTVVARRLDRAREDALLRRMLRQSPPPGTTTH